jgi:hypothetical protein
MPVDPRIAHILLTISNYFGFDDDSLSSLAEHRSLRNFLDDANFPLLSAIRSPKNSIDLSNEVMSMCADRTIDIRFVFLSLQSQIKVSEGSQCLVLFKVRPETITTDNIRTNVFLSSMIDSPLDYLHFMIKSIFSPALRDHSDKAGQLANEQVQMSLNELEQMIRTSNSSGASHSSASITNLVHPKDEIAYWQGILTNVSNKSQDLERAKYFHRLFEPVKANFDNLDK